MMLIGHLDSGIQSSLAANAARLDTFRDFATQGAILEDEIGHGTATASILVKMLPQARLIVGKCTGNGHDISRLLQGLNWLALSPARVICMPIGIHGIQPVFQGMINYLTQLGKLVVAPIGNKVCHSPGVYPNVLSIGAANSRGGPASFSPHYVLTGKGIKPDVLAPGVGIKVLKPNGEEVLANGTSYACAAASAYAAKLFEQFPGTSPAHMIKAITESADQRPRTRSIGGNLQYGAAFDWLSKHPDNGLPAIPASIEAFIDPYLLRLLAIKSSDLHCVLIAKEEYSWNQVKPSIQKVESEFGLALKEKQFLANGRTVLLKGDNALLQDIIKLKWIQVASASQPDPHPKPFSFNKVYR